jgi:hypothetical protein
VAIAPHGSRHSFCCQRSGRHAEGIPQPPVAYTHWMTIFLSLPFNLSVSMIQFFRSAKF